MGRQSKYKRAYTARYKINGQLQRRSCMLEVLASVAQELDAAISTLKCGVVSTPNSPPSADFTDQRCHDNFKFDGVEGTLDTDEELFGTTPPPNDVLENNSELIKNFRFTEASENKIKSFLHSSNMSYTIIEDPYLQALSELVIKTNGSDEAISTLCRKPDSAFSGRMLLRYGLQRSGNPTYYTDLVGEVIGRQLQQLCYGTSQNRRYSLRNRLCNDGFSVSNPTNILTSNPGDQDAHCDNHVAEKEYTAY